MKDIEIVAISKGAALHQKLDAMLAAGTVQKRLKKNGSAIAWGERFKAMEYNGVSIDLFITTEKQWGLIFLIRTGPGTDPDPRWPGGANQFLVTNRAKGGLLPNNMQIKDGWLWKDGKRLITREERDVYRLLGIPEIAPYERDIVTYAHWMDQNQKRGAAAIDELRGQQWNAALESSARARLWPAVGYPSGDRVFMPVNNYYVPYSTDMLVRMFERRVESPMQSKISVTMGV